MGISPSELTTIAVRDDVAVAEAFGETFLYYTSVNPSNGMPQRKVSFVKRVVTFGVPCPLHPDRCWLLPGLSFILVIRSTGKELRKGRVTQ